MKILVAFIKASPWLKLVIGVVGSAIVYRYIYIDGLNKSSPSIFALSVPGILALMGMVELVAGKRIVDIAKEWDSLAGWQRGVLGSLIVMLSFVLVGFILVLFE